MGSTFREMSFLKIDDKKFEENYNQIDWGGTMSVAKDWEKQQDKTTVEEKLAIAIAENNELKLINLKINNALSNLVESISIGEHVDIHWIKDEIQMQAESELFMKAKHHMEIDKLKKELEAARFIKGEMR